MKTTRHASIDRKELVATRDGYGKGLVAAGKENPRVVVLCADLTESTRSHWFKQKYPGRFIEVGVAEQNMAGIAAGLALSGKIPFISSYAVFSPGRNWDQVRVSICYSKANVKIAGAHAGISVGPDGATHQALEDIAITRVLPHLTVICPADAVEAQKATLAAARMNGPVYIRFGREAIPVVTTQSTPFRIGRAEVLKQGRDLTIVACGMMVYEALEASRMLAKRGVSVRVVNMHTIKPLDGELLEQCARETGAIVTAEEHQISGGLGSAVTEYVASCFPVPVVRVGVRNTFGESGAPDELMRAYGLTFGHIVEAARRALRLKK